MTEPDDDDRAADDVEVAIAIAAEPLRRVAEGAIEACARARETLKVIARMTSAEDWAGFCTADVLALVAAEAGLRDVVRAVQMALGEIEDDDASAQEEE